MGAILHTGGFIIAGESVCLVSTGNRNESKNQQSLNTQTQAGTDAEGKVGDGGQVPTDGGRL